MNTQSLKHNIEIIANVGVLLGIILLAYEVSQNNELLAAESRATHMLVRSGSNERNASEGDLMRIRVKSIQNAELTLDEELQLAFDAQASFTKWEWGFDQYGDGTLRRLPVNAYVGVMRTFPFFLTAWGQWGSTYSPDFVAFMEENVISQLE
jgi:hypothetical protein